VTDVPVGSSDAAGARPAVVPAGVCGLTNVGNTCFLSAVIQALSNVPAFAQHFWCVSGGVLTSLCVCVSALCACVWVLSPLLGNAGVTVDAACVVRLRSEQHCRAGVSAMGRNDRRRVWHRADGHVELSVSRLLLGWVHRCGRRHCGGDVCLCAQVQVRESCVCTQSPAPSEPHVRGTSMRC
jgi:hypothetical protein